MARYRRIMFDIPLAVVALILVIFGIIMVFSASGVEASERYQQPFHYFVLQIMGAAAGLFLIIFLVSVKKPFFQNAFFVYGLLAVTEGLLVLCLAMPSAANVNRWIILPGIRFQPSSFMGDEHPARHGGDRERVQLRAARSDGAVYDDCILAADVDVPIRSRNAAGYLHAAGGFGEDAHRVAVQDLPVGE